MKFVKNAAVLFLSVVIAGLILRCLNEGLTWRFDGVVHTFRVERP